MNQYMENTLHLKKCELSLLPHWERGSLRRGGACWQLHREAVAEPGPSGVRSPQSSPCSQITSGPLLPALWQRWSLACVFSSLELLS